MKSEFRIDIDDERLAVMSAAGNGDVDPRDPGQHLRVCIENLSATLESLTPNDDPVYVFRKPQEQSTDDT